MAILKTSEARESQFSPNIHCPGIARPEVNYQLRSGLEPKEAFTYLPIQDIIPSMAVRLQALLKTSSFRGLVCATIGLACCGPVGGTTNYLFASPQPVELFANILFYGAMSLYLSPIVLVLAPILAPLTSPLTRLSRPWAWLAGLLYTSLLAIVCAESMDKILCGKYCSVQDPYQQLFYCSPVIVCAGLAFGEWSWRGARA